MVDEAHSLKDPDSQICELLVRLNARYRWAITATPLINSRQDIFGLAKFLWRPEWEEELHADKNWDVFDPDVSIDDTRIALALNPLRIRKAFEQTDLIENRVDNFAALRKVMPKILLPCQLKRSYGIKLPEGDGTYCVIGADLPVYESLTWDVCLSREEAEE